MAATKEKKEVVCFMRKNWLLILTALCVLMVGVSGAFACTPWRRGKMLRWTDPPWFLIPATDGMITGFRSFPGGTFEEGATTPVYQRVCQQTRPGKPLVKVMDIPQVKETYTYFNIGYPFMNEHQLIMGEDTWSGRDENGTPEGAFWIETLQIFGTPAGQDRPGSHYRDGGVGGKVRLQ